MRLALLVLALLTLAPLAGAHVESYSQSRAVQAGPYLIFFEPRPAPPYANHTVSMVAQVSDSNTGGLVTDVPITVVVGGPGDFAERKAMNSDGTGYMVASMLLPERGNYSARLFVEDPNTGETHSADAEFEVFPDLPFRVRPVDQGLDVYTGQRTPLAFEIVDPITLNPKDSFASLDVRVEHWSEDHTEFLGAEEMEAEKVTTGVWRIEPVFREPGMYHLRFASVAGGFNYADVPLLHIYAITPQQGGVDEKDTPAPALVAILSTLALLAILRKR